MYCESCGKIVSDNAKFCRHCGAQIELQVADEDNDAKNGGISFELSTAGKNNHWRLFPLVLGIFLFITVIICIKNRPDPIFLLFSYPFLAGIGGLILVLVRKNSIFVAVILLLLSMGYIFFAFIGFPPLTLSGVLTNSYFHKFSFSTRIFFMSAAVAKLLLTVGAVYMIVFEILRRFKIKQAVVVSLLVSIILSVSIPAYSLINKVSAPRNGGNTVEAVEKIEPSHKVLLSREFPPSESSMKNEFERGEAIYPNCQGLKGGTAYGFRITGTNGEIVEPLYENAVYSAVDNAWTNGGGCFNKPERPLSQGNYKVELIVVESGNAFITARTDLTVKSSEKNP
mgnify:CR=1 FL=1